MRLAIGALVFLTLGISSAADAGDGYLVMGRVLENGTERPLPGVTLYILENEAIYAVTGVDGRFELTIKKKGDYTLGAIGLGFKKPASTKFGVTDEGSPPEIVVYMESTTHTLKGVTVEADRNPDKVSKTVITGESLERIAGSGGDPLKAITALPGISAGGFGGNPVIRGGGPSDNIYYVDFLPVGYLFHLGGLVSVLNPDLVDDFNIYSSAFGPEFGDAIGGVIDVKLREPRRDRFGGKINISLFETDVLIEGPVADEQAFYLAARRSYIDLFLPATGSLDDSTTYRQFPQFTDYQGKYIWAINDDNRLTVSVNGARDEFIFTIGEDSDEAAHEPDIVGDIGSDRQYNIQGVVLQSSFANGAINKIGLRHNNSKMIMMIGKLGDVDVETDDYYLRDELKFNAGKTHDITIGAGSYYSKTALDIDLKVDLGSEFDPGSDSTGAPRRLLVDTITAVGWSLFLKDRWNATERFTLITGARMTYDDYLEEYRTEPRLGAEYDLTQTILLTAGWGIYHQAPAGVEVIEEFGNPELTFLTADHWVVGVRKKLGMGWIVKTEAYYKEFAGLVVPDDELNVVNGGSGSAFGLETLIKKGGDSALTGWLAVTLSESRRKNDLTGESFVYSYDQPVAVSLVANYKLSDKWSFGAKWEYHTGTPYTPVVATYEGEDGRILPIYGDIGSERLPDYHRLDLRLDRDYRYKTWMLSTFFEMINVYGRENVGGYQYNADYSEKEPVARLPILISFGVRAEL